jgi:hypothetical protein
MRQRVMLALSLLILLALSAVPVPAAPPGTHYICQVYSSGSGRVCTYCEIYRGNDEYIGYFISCGD